MVVKDGAEQECSGYVCDRGVVTELVLGGPGGIVGRERGAGGLKPTLRKDTAESTRAEAHATGKRTEESKSVLFKQPLKRIREEVVQ